MEVVREVEGGQFDMTAGASASRWASGAPEPYLTRGDARYRQLSQRQRTTINATPQTRTVQSAHSGMCAMDWALWTHSRSTPPACCVLIGPVTTKLCRMAITCRVRKGPLLHMTTRSGPGKAKVAPNAQRGGHTLHLGRGAGRHSGGACCRNTSQHYTTLLSPSASGSQIV
jgi:hypothetical protein